MRISYKDEEERLISYKCVDFMSIEWIKFWSGCNDSIPFWFRLVKLFLEKQGNSVPWEKDSSLLSSCTSTIIVHMSKDFQFFPHLLSSPSSSYLIFSVAFMYPCFILLVLMGCAALGWDPVWVLADWTDSPLSFSVPSCPSGLCIEMAKGMRDVIHSPKSPKRRINNSYRIPFYLDTPGHSQPECHSVCP